ncbi:MAG: 5-oxoprolinase subunit PxpB [Xanthobacteraceae bacterium]|nr:MAG: 5-oxoprolinase subunit PxpB [Xanthobacteraceae bacterium]
MTAADFRILPCGDAALSVEFGAAIDPVLNDRVLALDRLIAARRPAAIIETVPTYRALLVAYDPCAAGFDEMARTLSELAAAPPAAAVTGRRWRVPVVYGGEFGVDLDAVARATALTTAEVIALHARGDYRVYMIGFTPGFTYLGGLDERLALSRRDEPRLATPSGTVSIGGGQAAIQCLAGPSGWHLLGRTPARTFHPARTPVFLIEPGDHVSFVAVAAREWDALDRAAQAGEPVAELIA